MKTKLLIVFALLGLCIASAKSYEITITSPSKAGSVQLQPGKYAVAVEAEKVRFTSMKNHQTLETSAKVEKSEKKFNSTSIDSHEKDGKITIDEIELGGSQMRLKLE